MEKIILELSQAGKSDGVIADHLTALGYRSPSKPFVLSNTVKIIRLKHGVFQVRSQSHPRCIPGYLTISQIARALDISNHWIYDRINNGTIQVDKDPKTRLYLFPDEPTTVDLFKQLKSGQIDNLRFSGGHQHV